MKTHIIVVGAFAESLLNFRGDLLKKLTLKEKKVTALAEYADPYVISRLNKIKVNFKSFPIQRNGLNPIKDLMTFLRLRKIFLYEKPNVVLAYTIKPIIWGGMACRVIPNTRFYALITGLGFALQGGSLIRNILAKFSINLYRFSLKRSEKVIFQNPDNLKEFISKRIIPPEKCELVNGSGVDTSLFSFTPLSNQSVVKFLAIGRLLGEKGFREYAKAAKIVKDKYPNTIFQLLGPEDPSPDGLSKEEVKRWQKQGSIEYLGSTSNVLPYIQSCHIYVLPSYHEGMPRTVLEAMSIGRPILTTDVPGCRETVTQGINGFLVPKADVQALADRMIWFIENQSEWSRMGKRSRELAEEKYDVHKVNAQLMEIMGL